MLSGLVEHSSRGAWASISKSFGPQVERVAKQATARKEQGVDAVEGSTTLDRDEILAAFERSKEGKRARTERMEKDAASWEDKVETEQATA